MPWLMKKQDVTEEAGRYTLHITCYMRVLKYWFHVLHRINDRIPRQPYLMLKILDEQGKINWASGMKEILHSTSFGFVWEEQGLIMKGNS